MSQKLVDYFMTISPEQNQTDDIFDHKMKMRSQHSGIIDDIILETNQRFK